LQVLFGFTKAPRSGKNLHAVRTAQHENKLGATDEKHTWMKDVSRSNEVGFDLFHGISFGAYYFF
jgi:hypothetical protein